MNAQSKAKLIQITTLPQYVPSSTCLDCDVCCRFPEADSFLRPYFTSEEIREAVAHGVDAGHFQDQNGGQIQLVLNPIGEGYLCPAFDQATSQCRIYDVRPLDCRIYPLAVMWSADGAQVVLGWDTKCPFLRTGAGREALGARLGTADTEDESAVAPRASRLAPEGSLDAYGDKIAALIEQDAALDLYASNPTLIGRFQEDVVVLRRLPQLTERLSPARVSRLDTVLRPLTLADRSRFEQAMAVIETPLSAYGFAPHAIWRELFTYAWCLMAEHLCMFAEYEDGIYMPLPPLGHGSLAEPLAEAFALMHSRNHGSAVTRIENVPEELTPTCEALGYRVVPKDAEYLYATSDLVSLVGDRYKSQRGAFNRFARTHQTRLEPYQEADRAECLTLFEVWAAQQEARGLDVLARHMLKDAESAHREALTVHDAIGLVGRVVRIGGAIRAYTFGYAQSSSVFCVLLEVADRSVTGLGQYIFREFCREAAERGHRLINTMDDSGLQGLRLSKYAYRPRRVVGNYIVSDPTIRLQNPRKRIDLP